MTFRRTDRFAKTDDGRPMIVVRTAASRALHLTLVTAGVILVLMYGAMTDERVGYSYGAPAGSAAQLIEDHGCADQADPTHVVVTRDDGRTVYGGRRMTDRAIEQAVFGVDHGLTVHAFCS